MLVDDLKRVQADTFAMYAKAHYFHWNIEGVEFVQWHDFLGEIYNALWPVVDDLAEFVRQLDAYAPGVNRMMTDLTHIKNDDGIPPGIEMFKRLEADNDTVMEGIVTAYMSADAAGELGLSNFLQDRMMYHKKLRWMLRSITK
jgi:starvation-inducible DNA-binding protein